MRILRWFVVLLGSTGPVMAADVEQGVVESRLVTEAFMGQLKNALQTAIKAGGPAHAIEVCKVQAPAIASTLSKEKGWEVGRTSLRYRNPDNAPDAWEESVLTLFEHRNAEGENPLSMEYFEVLDSEGGPRLRYMKAIPTGGVCLKCHGSHIAPEVQEQLQVLYPNDRATGFELGDIRGAFTITQPLD